MSKNDKNAKDDVRQANGYKIVRVSKDNAAIKIERYELTWKQRNKLRIVRMPTLDKKAATA